MPREAAKTAPTAQKRAGPVHGSGQAASAPSEPLRAFSDVSAKLDQLRRSIDRLGEIIEAMKGGK